MDFTRFSSLKSATMVPMETTTTSSVLEQYAPTDFWQEKPVTVLGLSRTGSATVRYLQAMGARCFLSDASPSSPANVDLRRELTGLGAKLESGGHTKQCYTHSDLIVLSPGIPPSAQIIKQLTISGKELISEVELANRESRRRKPTLPWIGITGTNGKSTTTSLISHILTADQKYAPACGNIGLPVLDVMANELNGTLPALDALVVELSSFQLQFSPSLSCAISVWTNFTPDHTEWHGSLETYKTAKKVLFAQADPKGFVVLNANDAVSFEMAAITPATVVWYGLAESDIPKGATLSAFRNDENQIVLRDKDGQDHPITDCNQLGLIGDHNHANVMAALLATYLHGTSIDTISASINTFTGLSHRLEFVKEIEGVRYYNDSKATNPDAAITALNAFGDNKVVLIAGGYDKMAPLDAFSDAVKANAEAVVLTGPASQRFKSALQTAGFDKIEEVTGLQEAIATATALAKSLATMSKSVSHKPAVLLSPACASFDEFKDFEVRGTQFKTWVNEL